MPLVDTILIEPKILLENIGLKPIRLGYCKYPPGALPIPQLYNNYWYLILESNQ